MYVSLIKPHLRSANVCEYLWSRAKTGHNLKLRFGGGNFFKGDFLLKGGLYRLVIFFEGDVFGVSH